MADTSPILSLPYLAPSQAQKHVTHNEALQRLDILVQLRVAGFDATEPPAVPAEGAVYATGAGAQDAWAGQDDRLAAFSDGAWLFIDPAEGWHAIDTATGALRVFQGGAWGAVPLDNLDGLGINAAADATNRLAVSSEATLLNHDGAGHQLKINKAAEGDTASLLFQSGYSGRAEMGLAGSDAWSLKVSPDGSAWNDALVATPATGNIGIGTNDPKYALHIHRPGVLGASVLLSNGTTGQSATDGFWFGYSNKAYFWNYEATDTLFATSNATRMTITAGGNIGIGTTTPSAPLEVAGAVRCGRYASGARPTAASVGAGASVYDTTLSLPLWSDGTAWRDAAGAVR